LGIQPKYIDGEGLPVRRSHATGIQGFSTASLDVTLNL
jgi:hypothetical protein